jgi:hypothetical protein
MITNKYSHTPGSGGLEAMKISTRYERERRINYKNTLSECFMKIIINILRFCNLKANKLENVAKRKSFGEPMNGRGEFPFCCFIKNNDKPF